MDKGIARAADAIQLRKNAVPHQRIAEAGERWPRCLRRSRGFDAVMKVHFDFTPAIAAVLREKIDQTLVVLLDRVKIDMTEGPSVMVRPTGDGLLIIPAPALQSLLLQRPFGEFSFVVGKNSGLEVVGKS